MIHLTCNITNLYYSARWHARELCNSLFERVFYCIYAISHPDTSLWCQFPHFYIQNEVSHPQKFAKKIYLWKSPQRSVLSRGALSGCQPRSNRILSKSSSGYKENNLKPLIEIPSTTSSSASKKWGVTGGGQAEEGWHMAITPLNIKHVILKCYRLQERLRLWLALQILLKSAVK